LQAKTNNIPYLAGQNIAGQLGIPGITNNAGLPAIDISGIQQIGNGDAATGTRQRNLRRDRDRIPISRNPRWFLCISGLDFAQPGGHLAAIPSLSEPPEVWLGVTFGRNRHSRWHRKLIAQKYDWSVDAIARANILASRQRRLKLKKVFMPGGGQCPLHLTLREISNSARQM
jgi:hypothetical protein